MLGLFAPRCPLGPRERVWVERGMARLLDVLGQEWMRRTPVLTADDLDDLLSVEPIAAAAIAARLAPQFPTPIDGIQWHEEADISGQQTVEYLSGVPPIGVVPQQPNQTPELRTAHVARCLCQHVLASLPGSAGTATPPPLAVDLLGVLSGVGLFAANSSVMSRQSQERLLRWLPDRLGVFMPSRLYGYAFALRCCLSDENPKSFSSMLRPDAREPFEAGLKFFWKRRPVVWDQSRDTLRTFRDPPPREDVIHSLRHRDQAVQINALDDVVQFGLNDAAMCQELGHLVHDPGDEVREETVRTISLLDVESADLGEALTIFCDDSLPRIRSLAAQALGVVHHPPAEAVELLRSLTGDPEPSVSSAAAESLLVFPEGLAEERPRIFGVLRQQLARCKYASVDRFMDRLQQSVTDAAGLIREEFSSAEEGPWREILLQSLAAVGAGGAESSDAIDPGVDRA